MGLVDHVRRSLFGYSPSFSFNGNGYTLPGFGTNMLVAAADGTATLSPDAGLVGYAEQVYKSNGPIFALIAVRQLAFSTVEFKWQNQTTRELFGTTGLRPLEEPWPGGTTQNLLARCEVDASLAGNSYWWPDGNELVWLRPDWVDVVLAQRVNGTWRKAGFLYFEGGDRTKTPTLTLTSDEVVHYMPLADPLAPWRGMSWITPVLRETQVDWASTTHQQKFFEQGATLKHVFSYPKELTPEQFLEHVETFKDTHQGTHNAYKTLHLSGGADLTVVGTNLSDLDLRNVQGGLETRLAAAAGVPVSVVGFREGNQGSALNASTYAQARRRFADGTLDPLWREVAGSFSKIVSEPTGARLWFDTRHVPFLREDAKDAAEIMQSAISTIRQGVESGFDPDRVVQAVMNDDLRQLMGAHSGLTSVQLQPAADGTQPSEDSDSPTEDGGASS